MVIVRKCCLIFFMSAILYGCYRHNEQSIYPASLLPGGPGCDTINVSYDSTISPLLMQNCAIAGCHASSSSPSGYVLDNYSGVKTVVNSGFIIGVINHANGFPQMPKDRPVLNQCQIALITSWINQGAQNN